MEPVPVGNGEIRVLPLAFESFGVRSMATLVETDDVKLVVDPGSALGPRFKLSPHEREYMALAQSRQVIINAARDADVLTISHYHFDHYVPSFEDWTWTWSSPKLAERLYRGKLILVKDIHSDINLSQRKRGYMFQKLNSKIAKEIQVADGKKFEFSRTTLEFSKPVFHGAADSQLGYVLMLTVRTPVCSFMHASDVQGPIDEEALRLILKQRPNLLVIGGPPLYLKNFKIDEESLANALNNMVKIVKAIPLTVIDHHLLRSLDYKEYLTPVFAEAEKSGHRVLSASELVGQEPQLLEAKRKELHAREPIKREQYERLSRGDFKGGFQE
ncbi:MAG: MBL fold metallo-hydrolase [Candidatus Hadarchaeaceae archaeon]